MNKSNEKTNAQNGQDVRENLQLELVKYSDNEKKVTLSFVDTEKGEMKEVHFNKQIYKDGKFIDDEEKAKKAEEWSKQHFNLPFNKLEDAIGALKTVYCYAKFNSLYQVTEAIKPTADMMNKMHEGTITSIEVDNIAIKIHIWFKEKIYTSNMRYAEYLETRKEWFKDTIKEKKQREKFYAKYGCTPEDADKLKGKHVFFEVKKAFNTFYYIDIKALKQD